MEEIKTEEEVKRVCSGFGDNNNIDYGPNPADASNVYGPGAGAAAAAVAGAGGRAMGGQEQAAQIAAQISAQVMPELVLCLVCCASRLAPLRQLQEREGVYRFEEC